MSKNFSFPLKLKNQCLSVYLTFFLKLNNSKWKTTKQPMQYNRMSYIHTIILLIVILLLHMLGACRTCKMPQSRRGNFVGYNQNCWAYRPYDPMGIKWNQIKVWNSTEHPCTPDETIETLDGEYIVKHSEKMKHSQKLGCTGLAYDLMSHEHLDFTQYGI